MRFWHEETMRRREFIALAGASVAWPFAAMAQEPGRMYRVGGLSTIQRNSPPIMSMFDELRRLGFIEGQNLIIDWRPYALHIDLIPEFAAEFVKSKVDVIYASGDPGIRAAQQATATIPILGITQDMVAQGLVSSFARPGGNTTGVSVLAIELDGKRQEILIEAVPELRSIAILADTKATRSPQLQALQDAARARGVEVSIHQVASAEEITAAIDAAKASGAAALNVLSSPLLYGNRQLIMDRVAALRLPAIYPFPEEAEEGGFVAYGPSIIHIFRELMAQKLVKLLRGVKPADIPVEHQVRAGNQPQDRQSDRCDGSRGIIGASRQGDRMKAAIIRNDYSLPAMENRGRRTNGRQPSRPAGHCPACRPRDRIQS
jgi:putative ABC transport system substrate-binding protein